MAAQLLGTEKVTIFTTRILCKMPLIGESIPWHQGWFHLHRALPDITVRSGSPATFQSPDSIKTGHSPSRTPDFYHLKKLEKNQEKNPKKIFKKIFKIFFFCLFIYLACDIMMSNFCS